MSDQGHELTLGQEFALRWMCRMYNQHRDRFEASELFQDIAGAVDAFVARKQAELSRQLREALTKSLEGDEGFRAEIVINARELLESDKLVWVAQKLHTKLDRVTRFPTP